jgi:hypothetical protein
LNLGPIFGRLVHIPISNNFYNYSFPGCHKKIDIYFINAWGFFVRWLQIKGRVQNGTTPVFKGMGH